MVKPVAVIIGAGPAGLTSALELLRRSNVLPVVLEADGQVGGISKTVNYRGNRMDLGGHRFFSKSDWVMQWWQSILPVAQVSIAADPLRLHYQGQSRDLVPLVGDSRGSGNVMLVRSRLSRIYYRRRFFDYPLKLNRRTLRNLGPAYAASIGMSYVKSRVTPRSPEVTLEDFLINRFGDRLYRTFFKDYTEKVWGTACSEISAEWGAQRIKGLSIAKALKHALYRPFQHSSDLTQHSSETSLIERFLYPRLGPGQLWELVAERIGALGGEVHLRHRVVGIRRVGRSIQGVDVLDEGSGEVRHIACNHLISTMPIKELTDLLRPEDSDVSSVASSLPYRDFVTAGLLVRRMRASDGACDSIGMPPDNWIYIQEPDVKLGRVQIFNNWSPDLVAKPGTIWLGLEYFCKRDDEFWSLPDGALLELAGGELAKIGLIDRSEILDGTVVRVPKAYPAYFGSYRDIHKVRTYLDTLPNLFPVGRNGMHRYNNQDHSMLAAKAAVDCIVSGSVDKSALWAVNAEQDYHEDAAPRNDDEPLSRAA